MRAPRARISLPSRQRGQSLISMMVGLLISLITIAAMLVLYKTMIEVSANASRSALRDGQVSAAVLAAQMEIQSAGFGVPSSDALPTKLVLRAEGKEVVWRFKAVLTDGGFQCAGLRVEDGQALYRLTPKACSDATSSSWTASERELMTGAAAFFVPARKDGEAFDAAEEEVGAMSLAPGYVFVLKSERQCLPFMQQDTATAAELRLGQQVAMERADGSSRLFQACLPNLAVTTS